MEPDINGIDISEHRLCPVVRHFQCLLQFAELALVLAFCGTHVALEIVRGLYTNVLFARKKRCSKISQTSQAKMLKITLTDSSLSVNLSALIVPASYSL